MTHPHWHVFVSMPGCLPDVIDYHDTKASADDGMRWHRDGYRDYIAETPEGQERPRIWGSVRSGLIVFEQPSGAQTLITRERCTAECDPEDCY